MGGSNCFFFFFQAEDGIRDHCVTWSSDVCSSDLAANPDLNLKYGEFMQDIIANGEAEEVQEPGKGGDRKSVV